MTVSKAANSEAPNVHARRARLIVRVSGAKCGDIKNFMATPRTG